MLNLWHNQLGTAGALAIAENLSRLTSLNLENSVHFLTGTLIGDEGAVGLPDACPDSPASTSSATGSVTWAQFPSHHI